MVEPPRIPEKQRGRGGRIVSIPLDAEMRYDVDQLIERSEEAAVRALIVPYDVFSSFLDAHPGAGKAYRHVVTHRWNDADSMLRSHPVTNGAHRLAVVLPDQLHETLISRIGLRDDLE